MRLTRVFLERPTLVFVLIALTLLAAVMALRTLVVQQSPNAGLPAISVSIPYAGASTTELVTEVAEPVEDQLAGTPYLDHIDTTIQTGQVNITAAFSTQSTDTENIANVEKAVQAAQRQLPTTITPPTLRVADPSEPVVVSLALVSSKYPEPTLASIANNSIVPVIEQLPGVSNVNVTGTTQPAFMVTVDPSLLAADNLTVTDVVGAIQPNNVRAPGGFVYQPGHETQLDVRGDLSDPQAVANLPIHVAYAGTASAAATGGASTAGAAYGSTGAGAGSGTSASASAAQPASAAGASARVAGLNTRPRPSATVPPARIPAFAATTRGALALATAAPMPAGSSFATAAGGGTAGTAAGTASGSTGTAGGTTGTGATTGTAGSTGGATGSAGGAAGSTTGTRAARPERPDRRRARAERRAAADSPRRAARTRARRPSRTQRHRVRSSTHRAPPRASRSTRPSRRRP
ncbi:MAG TPA: efflux RND transporter permease subunit, partial [Candidatus Elarobacter sp.]|nr:efflux RND transporter permease subunit [Candidatus Elarobacter sp.]